MTRQKSRFSIVLIWVCIEVLFLYSGGGPKTMGQRTYRVFQ